MVKLPQILISIKFGGPMKKLFYSQFANGKQSKSRKAAFVFLLIAMVLGFLSACEDSSSATSNDQGVSSSAALIESSSSSEDETGELPKEAYLNPNIDYGTMTDERNGLTYKTVTIGNQTWTAENMNYKTSGSICNDDYTRNCNIYGSLYLGREANLACPTGWHLPSNEEFEELFEAVGGIETAGKMLKSAVGWEGDENNTDPFGFSAIAAGGRFNFGSHSGEGSSAYFWTSSVDEDFYPYYVQLRVGNDGIYQGSYQYKATFPVRCVKD